MQHNVKENETNSQSVWVKMIKQSLIVIKYSSYTWWNNGRNVSESETGVYPQKRKSSEYPFLSNKKSHCISTVWYPVDRFNMHLHSTYFYRKLKSLSATEILLTYTYTYKPLNKYVYSESEINLFFFPLLISLIFCSPFSLFLEHMCPSNKGGNN